MNSTDIFFKQEDTAIYGVSQLNREVRILLENGFSTIWLKGEISNFACPISGHMYFSLKDNQAQVRCAMFRGNNKLLTFEPKNGAEVLIRANVTLYESRGDFQLLVEHMEIAGEGALLREYELLKKKLLQQGLFATEHKQDLPYMPLTIGILTSPTGAALRDVLSVLQRRYRAGSIIIYPVPVQGTSAAKALSRMLNIVVQRNECDVLIIARGGGSIEDLAAFNSEQLARDIFHCPIPTISGIGHETDFTIADFVVDQRAATPSAAAELASADQLYVQKTLASYRHSLRQAIVNNLQALQKHVAYLQSRIVHPQTKLQHNMQRLDNLADRMWHTIQSMLTTQRYQLDSQLMTSKQHNIRQKLSLAQMQLMQLSQRLQTIKNRFLQDLKTRLKLAMNALDAVSPLATLQRGYVIMQYDNGKVISDHQQIKVGDKVHARFAQGQAKCTIDEVLDKPANED
ncbi:Exodeoxyribonuclease VII large subunit [uncultured Candidatus Thioglobus sp.]|nr:Exodeoxyribonuclease VII large subunit [uncultured Candidatus Thioglobus sp.]